MSKTHAAEREVPFSWFKKKKDYAVSDTVVATFPGGERALMRFINRNLKFPKDAPRELLIEGSVVVRFLITEDGKVDSAMVMKSVYPAFDNEVLRVVSLLPDFEPATANGVRVKIWYTMPVTFLYDRLLKNRYAGSRKARNAEIYLNGNRVDNINMNAISDEDVDSIVPGTKVSPPKIYITLKPKQEK